MKATAGNDAAVVEFTGKVQRMVNVHQYGLKDKPGPDRAEVIYPSRILLGINSKDCDMITDVIIGDLTR